MQQLERYRQYFPPEQILTLCSEQLFSEPGGVLTRVFDFVGVDPGFKVKDERSHNAADNRIAVDPEIREYLNSYFFPHNQALYAFLGENYGWDDHPVP